MLKMPGKTPRDLFSKGSLFAALLTVHSSAEGSCLMQLLGLEKVALAKYLVNAIFGYFYFITAIWLMRFWGYYSQKIA